MTLEIEVLSSTSGPCYSGAKSKDACKHLIHHSFVPSKWLSSKLCFQWTILSVFIRNLPTGIHFLFMMSKEFRVLQLGEICMLVNNIQRTACLNKMTCPCFTLRLWPKSIIQTLHWDIQCGRVSQTHPLFRMPSTFVLHNRGLLFPVSVLASEI